jgi:tryptophan synthase beta chain
LPATDKEVLDAVILTTQQEGILPALESAHALAYAYKLAPTLSPDQMILVNISGRGDKDLHTILDHIQL